MPSEGGDRGSLTAANEPLKTRLASGANTRATVAQGMPRQPGSVSTGPPGDAECRLARLRRAIAAGATAIGGLATLAGQLSAPAPSALGNHPAAGDAAVLAIHAL